METNTGLPLAAVALDGDGQPWYPFRPTPASPVLFLEQPYLTIPGAQWAPVPPEYSDRPYVRLDERVVADLLYFDDDPSDTSDIRSLAAHLGRVLRRVGCSYRTLAGWLGGEYGHDLLYQHANERMQDCRRYARSLFRTESGA